METIINDLRFAARRLRHAPGFSLVAILTLALGIGSTSAIFSVINGVLLRPLEFPDSHQLVRVLTVTRTGSSTGENLSPPNFASLREETRSFTALAAVLDVRRTIVPNGEPVELDGAEISSEFFGILRVPPLQGRTFRAEENQPGAVPTIVLAHATWQELFAGDSSVVGRAVMVNGVSRQIVGIMPAGFEYPAGAMFWTPFEHGSEFSATNVERRRSNMWVPVIGRLRPGVSASDAAAELADLARRLQARFPESNTGVSFMARELQDDLVGDARTPFLLLFAAVGLVLLVACANVTALLLARAATKRHELAIRAALGASRGRLFSQLLSESFLLAGIGGVLGLLVAAWTPSAIVALGPDVPRLDEIRIDGPVIAFTVAIALATTMLVGLLPALDAARAAVAGTLRAGGRGSVGERGGSRLRGALVIGEIATAVTLLVGAGLLVRSLTTLISVDPGFRAEGAATFRVALPAAAYETAPEIRTTYQQLIDRARAIPGVQSVGATSRLPIATGLFTSRFLADGWPEPAAGDRGPVIGVRSITPGYFEAMQIPVREGRGIEPTDREGSLPVAIINEATARRYFPGENPIGKRLTWFSWDPAEGPAWTIVGIVGDIRHSSLDAEPHPEVYFPHAQIPLAAMSVVVRTASDPFVVSDDIRAVVREVAPRLPAPRIESLVAVVSQSVARPRFVATLLASFAATALVLASIGVFGLLSFIVAQRTREIGIRLALGAKPQAVIQMIVNGAARLVIAGLGIGLAASYLMGRGIRHLLHGVSPADPVTLVGVIGVIGLAAVAASLVPARRAARVDPMIALREE